MPKNPLISSLPFKPWSPSDLKESLTSQSVGRAAEYATQFRQKADYDKALANEAAQKAQQQIDISNDIASLYASKSQVDSLSKQSEYQVGYYTPLATDDNIFNAPAKFMGEVFAKKIEFNPEKAVKPEHNYTASLTKDILDSGWGKTQPALDELKKIVDNIDNGVDLDSATKEDLIKKYKNIQSYYSNKLKKDLATEQVDNLFQTKTPAQIQEILKKNAYSKTNSPQTLINDLGGDYDYLQNRLLDLDSYRPGSQVYNPNDLEFLKYNKPVGKISELTGIAKQHSRYMAELTTGYNNALLEAIADKQKNNYQETSKLDEELSKLSDLKTPEANEKRQALNAQRIQLTNTSNSLDQVSKTIEPYSDYYSYLKKFDPAAAESVKRDNAREVYANKNLAEGTNPTSGEHFVRMGEGYWSGMLKTASGISSFLKLDKSVSMGLNLSSDYYTPPQYRKGTDLNKDGQLKGKEIDLDENGQPVYVTNIRWKDPKTGEGNWNFWSATEQVAPIVADIAATLLLTRGVGMGARKFGASWANVAKLGGMDAAASKVFVESVAPRISTMGGTMATVFPRMYAEERKNFKDDSLAFSTALSRSIVEGLTESIVPETRLFSGSTKFGPLDNLFANISSKIDPTDLSRLTRATDLALGLLPANSIKPLKMAMLLAPMRIRKTISGALQETIEEEASLLGNYFIDKYASNQNADIEKTNELTAENFLNTAVEGFIPSLFISGAGVAQKQNKIERINSSRWDIANNPATYTALVDQQINKGKITPEEGLRRKVAIKQLSDRLDIIPELKNIKSLTTLLDDKERQRDFFLDTLFQEDLLQVDTTKLTPDELKDYENTLDQTQTKLQASKALADKYTNLTEPEKKDIISNVFNRQAERLEKPDATLGNLLNNGNYSLKELNQFDQSDERYDFLLDQHLKYKERVDTALNTKVDSLLNTLENNPEELTNLEALHLYHTLGPALAEYEKMHTAIPFAPVFGPKGKFGRLQDLAELEVNTRQYNSEDQIANEINRNLNNPEVKHLQNIQLGVSELSEQEIANGELEEGAHEHLSDAQRFIVGRMLEEHASQKEENPEQVTELENQRAYALSFFNNITQGLTEEDALAKIKEVNELGINYQAQTDDQQTSEKKKPLEKNNQTTELVKKSTASTDFVEPTADAQDIIDYLGLDFENTLPINVLVYTDVNAKNRVIDEIEEPQDKANDRIALFETVLVQEDPLDIYSGLLAMYGDRKLFPGQAKNIEQFFATYEDSPNTNLLPFLVKSQIGQLTEVLNEKLKPEEAPKEDIEEPPVEQIIEEIPQSTFEDEVTDGIIRDQELLSQIEQVPVTPRDLSLNIVSLDSSNVPLTDDARTAFAVNVVNAFDNLREKLPAVKLRIQGAMDTYAYVLSSAKFEALKTLKNKAALTPEDVATLKSILSLNGVPFHENSFIQYLIDNPSAIGTGVLSVLTDEEGKVMLFEKNGVPSQVGTPLISTFKVSTLKGQLKSLVDQIKANSETVAVANITGTIPGTDLVPIKLSSVKNKPNYSLRVVDTPTPDTTGTYTLYPGRTYIINSNNFFKSATAVTLPKADGQLVFKLVEAFNNGTLPNGLPESVEDFLSYLRTYQLTSFKSEKAVYVLDKNKVGDKIVFKKKNIAGKWQTVSTITPNVEQAIVEAFNDAYKNIVADRLNSNDRYYPTKLNSKGEIELLPATTYRDFVMSPEFGATFREEGNRTLGFDTPQINAPSSSQVTVSEVLENIPSQETPITEAENIPTPVPVQETPSENIPEVTTEQPVRKRRSPKDLNNEITVDRSQLERTRLLENKINAKQKARAKAWVENHPIFKNTAFIFDQTINHPEAYAVWSKAGIQLFNGANYADAYHEAWHEFTQLYLTPEQKQALYKEAAKIYGNLTPFELEEKMAEDFRLFALSAGKVFPEAIKKSKEAKNIFEKIWNFITNLFSNKKTVDFYFKQLYKGNIASYNRSEDNIRFKELFSRKLSVKSDEELKTYSFVESDKIVKQFDSLFTHVANQITKSVNGSFVNVAVSKQVIPQVYKGIKNIISQTYNELLDLEEAGDTTVSPKLDYLDELLNNFDTVAQFHIQNSLIFDDKVKRGIQLETLEEEQDANTELGSYDKSVNEISQKELASNLIISAIRTLPKHIKGNINPEVDYLFGVPQLGDFDTNWNILRRSLAGLTTYEQMYSRLKELSKEYPQFNSLINYLPTSIERFSSLSFKNEFFNLFTMPYMEGYTTKINKDEDGNVTDVKVQKSSSLDAVRLKNLYDGEFGMTQGLYKVMNPNTGLQDLDVDAYFTNNPSLPVGLVVLATNEEKRARIAQLINLLRPLGLNLSQAAVDSIPLEDMSVLERNVNFIRTKLKSLGENGTVGNPLNQLSSPHKVDKAVIKSENSAVNYFLNLEVKSNPEYIDDMRMNAEGSRVWSVNQHTFMSRVASALNDYETYPTAKDVYKAFPQLDPEYNSNTIGSFVLEYLFDKEGNRITDSYQGGKATYRQVELANLEGIKIEEDGQKTINTNYIDKHFAEVNSFLQSGVEEINRLSGKSTTRAFVLDLGLRKFLGMNELASKDGQGNIRLFDPQMRLLFKAIMSEIKMTKEIEGKIANGQKVYIHPKVSIRDSKGSPKLGYFEDILSSEQRTKLYNEFKDKDVTDENGENILNKLFEEAVEKYPIVIEIAKNFNKHFTEQMNVSLRSFKAKNLDTIEPVDLFKYHFFSFLSRLEQHKLFYGHPYYYKSAKDIEKRLSAWNAFGSYTMLDAANTAFLQNRVFTQRNSFIKYAEQNNIPINEQINDLSKVNYIVLKDNPVISKTALENKEAYGESLDAYTTSDKHKTQDAAAFMTVDFFKRFYALSTGITPEMDQEIDRQNRIYQAILDNDQVTLSKELNTKAFYKFTIKKLQYAGFAKGVNNEGVPVFHKYSVKPILPSEAVNNPELLAILHKLHASSADYAVFESGTKIAETVSSVSLFKDGKVDTTNVPIGQIDIKHLKEQVLIENKESFESVFSTQFRSLLYKDAEDAEVLKLYEAYKSYVKEIVDYDKLNYLENLNDKDKLVNFLLKELEKKNASEATKDLIKLKTDGSLMYMLDSMVDRTVMESAIVSSAKRKIIRQKLNGAQRVQYPVSIVRPGRTLKYYSLTKDGKKINKAEVIVSFSKGYYPLLNLMYEGSPIGELDANGEPTNPFDALLVLNEALNNPAFVKANEKALSMVAIRIPGQGYNSMENFTVVEFLPEESVEIILVPDEMVVKSGSDYDIDKLFCYDPYIKEDGTVPLTTQTAQQSFDRKKKLEKSYEVSTEEIKKTTDLKIKLMVGLHKILDKKGTDKNKVLEELYNELKTFRTPTSASVDEETIAVNSLQKLKERFTSEETIKKSNPKTRVAIEKLTTAVNKVRENVEITSFSEIKEAVTALRALYKERNDILLDIEGLRKTHANNLVFNVVDRLSQSDIFESLITPNSSDIIKGLAKEFGTIEPNTTATYTSILSPIYQLYVFNLNTYKKSLGVGAKINTFHSLVQKAKLNLENKSANRLYILPSNRIDGKVYYSSIYDVDGNLISLLNGQMISAHVDIEKEDEVARIYFNNLITPVVLYTAIAGTPISTVTRLINQKYKNQPTDEKSQRSSIVRYGLGTPAEDILEEMMSNPDIAKLIKVGTKGINVKKTVAQALNLLTSKTTDVKAIQDFLLTEETPIADFYRFMQFMEFEAQQKQLSTLSLNTDYHTFSPQNFESFRRGAEDLRQLRKEEYFNRSGVDYMISETEISPFQIQADILDKFVEVMPISANRKLTDIILTIHASLNKKGSKVDYEKFSRTFKNDLLYALFVNRVPEAQEYEQYLVKTNENNVVNMRNSLVSQLEKRGIESNNVIFDMFKQNTNNESAYIRTGLLLSSVDYSVNVYKEAFEEGLSWTDSTLNPELEEDMQLVEDMQKFFKVFAYAGILGTQLNKKIDSYLPLIPESIYTYSMSQVVNEFKNELDTVSAGLLAEVRNALSTTPTETEDDVEDALNTKLLSSSNFLGQFINRFQEVHPEFYKIFKNVNPDLAFFKDYRLDQENATPTKKKTVEENVPTPVTGNQLTTAVKVKEGVYVNQEGLTKEEQIELFTYLKPYLETQAAKTNKAKSANKMIGLGLRWDYKSNNSGITKLYPELGDRQAVNVGTNLAGKNTSYGYYTKSINGLDLGEITPRFRQLMSKATGIDISGYDGAIINLYDEDTHIGNHSDLDESVTAKNYPVVAVNIGGSGNFTAGTTSKDSIKLKPGAGYLFGLNGVNRTIPHSTLANKQDGFLPEITTQLDGRTYPAGSYRITITMRRVMPLTQEMPSVPTILNTETNVAESAPITTESVTDIVADPFKSVEEINREQENNCKVPKN